MANKRGSSGCMYLISMALIACLLLIFNGAFVAGFYGGLAGLSPALNHPRVKQVLLFLLPVALLLAEWWLLDLVVDWSTRSRRRPWQSQD